MGGEKVCHERREGTECHERREKRENRVKKKRGEQRGTSRLRADIELSSSLSHFLSFFLFLSHSPPPSLSLSLPISLSLFPPPYLSLPLPISLSPSLSLSPYCGPHN